MNISEMIRQDGSLQKFGLLVERTPDGDVRANVPHVRYHSPTGYECGYAGSGPADLALSVLHALLPPLSLQDEEAIYELTGDAFDKAILDQRNFADTIGPDEVRVSRVAYALHQRFKTAFIATMPKEGGYVPIDVILTWITTTAAQHIHA